MKNHVQPGRCLDAVAPAGGVTAGVPLKIGGLVGVPSTSALEGQTFAFYVTEVYDNMPAATGQAWTQFAPLYWDDTAKTFTTTATNNTRAGHAAVAKQSADAIGTVRLQPN